MESILSFLFYKCRALNSGWQAFIEASLLSKPSCMFSLYSQDFFKNDFVV